MASPHRGSESLSSSCVGAVASGSEAENLVRDIAGALGACRRPTLSTEELFGQLGSGRLEVGGYVGEDCAERTESKWLVARNCDVVLGALHARREPHMAACLTGDLVAVATKKGGELCAREISRQPQAGMTTSRTRCRRMIRGPAPSSKWQRTASRTMSFKASKVSAWV